MSDPVKFTEGQLEAWRKFERVRKGGRYNMFDPHARKATGLGEESYSFVMRNYSALKDAASK